MYKLWMQIIKFGITGVVNTLIDFGLFNLLMHLTGIYKGWPVFIFSTVSVSIAILNSYLMNRKWTFNSQQDRISSEMGRFLLVSIVGMLINSLMAASVSVLGHWVPVSVYLLPNIGKGLGAVLSATWNFLAYRYWVFGPAAGGDSASDCQAMEPGLVSIVIPAYNEEKRLEARVRQLMEGLDFAAEIVLVDDGSSDGTLDLIKKLADQYPLIRWLGHERNRGKGAAVKTGVLAARGEYIIYTDADQSFTLEHIKQIRQSLMVGHPIAIGSRQTSQGRRVQGESKLRRLLGRVFNLYVQTLLLRGIGDTQCGLKGFHHEEARAVFSRQRMEGFAFDVEILSLARALEYPIISVPVRVVDCEGSTVNPLLSPVKMGLDVLRIKTGLVLNIYELKNLTSRWMAMAGGTALFIAALLVRWPWLWTVPRYIDELREVTLAYAIYLGKTLPLHNAAHDIGSLHNYILAGIFELFGPNILWPRLYVAVTAALTVLLLYRLGLRMFDRWVGLLAAGLLLTNGMHILVTHMAWANCTTPFFFVLALLAMENARQKQSGYWLIAAAFMWAAALQTHSSVVIYILVAFIYVLSNEFQEKAKISLKWYIGAALAFLAGYANMIYYNIVSRGGSIIWLSNKGYAMERKPGLVSYFKNMEQMFNELIRSVCSDYSLHPHVWNYLSHPLFLLTVVLLAVGCYLAIKKKQSLPVWMLVGGFLIMPWINQRYVFYVTTRYIMPLILCTILLVSMAAIHILGRLREKVKNPRQITVPAAGLAVAFIIAQFFPYYDYCKACQPTNMSNQAAMDVMSFVDSKDKNARLVLVDKKLPLENHPLPDLLKIERKPFIMIPGDGGQSSGSDWTETLNRYRHEKILAVVSQNTYRHIQDQLSGVQAFPISSMVAFPQPQDSPRVIYVLEFQGR